MFAVHTAKRIIRVARSASSSASSTGACVGRKMAAAGVGGGGGVAGKRKQMSVVASAAKGSFFDMSATSLGSGTRDAPVDGSPVSFSKYAGKVVMVQNVATL